MNMYVYACLCIAYVPIEDAKVVATMAALPAKDGRLLLLTYSASAECQLGTLAQAILLAADGRGTGCRWK